MFNVFNCEVYNDFIVSVGVVQTRKAPSNVPQPRSSSEEPPQAAEDAAQRGGVDKQVCRHLHFNVSRHQPVVSVCSTR